MAGNGGQTGTLNGNTIVYKEQDGQYDYAIIETLTAENWYFVTNTIYWLIPIYQMMPTITIMEIIQRHIRE